MLEKKSIPGAERRSDINGLTNVHRQRQERQDDRTVMRLLNTMIVGLTSILKNPVADEI